MQLTSQGYRQTIFTGIPTDDLLNQHRRTKNTDTVRQGTDHRRVPHADPKADVPTRSVRDRRNRSR
jgi:hypothetical protein